MQFVKLFMIMKSLDSTGEAKEKSRSWQLRTLPFVGTNEACLLSGFLQPSEMSDATQTTLAKAHHQPPPNPPLCMGVFSPLLTFHSQPVSTDGPFNVDSKYFSH